MIFFKSTLNGLTQNGSRAQKLQKQHWKMMNQAQPRAEVEDLTVDQTLTSQASHLITAGPDSSPHWNQMIIWYFVSWNLTIEMICIERH